MMLVDDEFIDRILDGKTSNQEAVEFQRWLQVPENLQRYALRAELHAELRRSLRRRHIQNSAVEASAGEAFDDTVLSESPVFRSRRNLLVGTAFVTATCLLIALMWPQSDSDPSPTYASVASVVSQVNGVLTKDRSPWEGTEIPTGRYELQEGLASLRFGGGVMVYLEAPARFNAISEERLVLYSGRLSARVPAEGIGFTVETPEAEVVDFGTEFSVDVEGGTSEVHVFDGLVRVHPGSLDRRDVSKSVDLKASQAVRITERTTTPETISLATDRFIRNFDEPRVNFARTLKRLSPLAFYRMPIRDRGLVSDPLEYSGIVLQGDGKRPPHARGVFVGGSLRVGADSTGRGGRVDSPPALSTGHFSLTAFVYREAPLHSATIVTNMHDGQGSFKLSLDENGKLKAAIKNNEGTVSVVQSESILPPKTWRHVVVTADGNALQIYEDGQRTASQPSRAIANSSSGTVWFGTEASATQLWNGRIDEVALFDKVLDEEDVAALYRSAQDEIARTK